MAFNASVLRVLIASPSDVVSERNKIEEAIIEWNRRYAEELQVVLLSGRWENDVVPTYRGHDPQQIINEQLVNKCDILIGVFWTRLGTPTLNHTSGTLEEISLFIEKKKEVMLYFVDKDVPRSVDFRQLEKVDKYKSEYGKMGIYSSFEESKIIDHLYKKVTGLKKRSLNSMTVVLKDQDVNNIDDSSNSGSLEIKNNRRVLAREFNELMDEQKSITYDNDNLNFHNQSLISNEVKFVQILRKDLGIDWLEGAIKNKPNRLNFLMGFPYQFNPSPKRGDRFLACIRDDKNRVISYLSAEVENYYSHRLVMEIVNEDRNNQVDFGFSDEGSLHKYLDKYENNKSVVCVTLRNIDYGIKEVPEGQLKLIKYGLHIIKEDRAVTPKKVNRSKLRLMDSFGEVF